MMLKEIKRLRLAGMTAATLVAMLGAMTGVVSAQTTKPDAETTKKVEAAQKAETTPAKGQWAASTPFPMPMEEPVGAVVDGKLYIIQGLTDGAFSRWASFTSTIRRPGPGRKRARCPSPMCITA